MKIFKPMLYAVVFILLASCQKEKKITPDIISPEYQLPQGNHPYDSRIVNFHRDYGTYILYKFSLTDFAWNVSVPLSPYILYAPADEQVIEQSLDFLDEKVFSYYNTGFLKQNLPYKIMLAANLEDTDFGGELLYSVYTYNQLTFGYCDERLASLDPAEIYQLKSALHYSLWASAIASGKISPPPLFKAATNYADVYFFNKSSFGVLGNEDIPNVTTDLQAYVRMITSNSLEELEESLFQSFNDPNGRYRFKYDAIIQYYKAEYDVDLQAIGNAK